MCTYDQLTQADSQNDIRFITDNWEFLLCKCHTTPMACTWRVTYNLYSPCICNSPIKCCLHLLPCKLQMEMCISFLLGPNLNESSAMSLMY